MSSARRCLSYSVSSRSTSAVTSASRSSPQPGRPSATPRCSRCRCACRRGWRPCRSRPGSAGGALTLLDRRPSRASTWAGMSRHQMTVRVAISQRLRGRGELRRRGRRAASEVASSPKPVVAMLEREAEPVGGGARPARAAPDHRSGRGRRPAGSWRSTSPGAPDGDRSRGRGSRAARSCGRGSRSARRSPGSSSAIAANVAPAGEELVAVGARQPLDALLGEDRIEQAAGAAVGVGDEDPLVAVARAPADRARTAAGSRRAGCGGRRGRQATSSPGRSAPSSGDELAGRAPRSR